MNAIVQTINTSGRAFAGFAAPMLIQSGLLILILLAVDAVLRKRVRAVFRYWIWMLVLVKLVLPPSLWSPVSLGTWFGDTLDVPATALLEPEPLRPPLPWQASSPHRTLCLSSLLCRRQRQHRRGHGLLRPAQRKRPAAKRSQSIGPLQFP